MLFELRIGGELYRLGADIHAPDMLPAPRELSNATGLPSGEERMKITHLIARGQ